MPEENGTTKSMRLPHPSRPSDFVRVGFLTSLGAVLLALLALVVWKLSGAALSIITPFVVGTTLAMLLDPVVDRLQKYMSRGFAVFMVFGAFVAILVAAGVYGVPALTAQVDAVLPEAGREYINTLRD